MSRSSVATVLSALVALPACLAAETVLTDRTVVVQERPLASASREASVLDWNATPQALADADLLSEQTANLSIASSGARSFNDTLSLRGLVNTPIFGDPAVTTYMDEIPLGGAFTFPGSLALFQGAELSRGPGENSRVGRAGSGGVIRLTTPRAQLDPGGTLRSGFGDHHSLWGSATAATSASAPVSFSAGVASESREGYVTNTTLQQRVDDRESQSGFARLELAADDSLSFALLGNFLRARDGAQPMVPLGGPLFSVSRSAEGRSSLDSVNAGLSMKARTPWGSLASTTSVNDWRLSPFTGTMAFGPSELSNAVSLAQRNCNQELSLVSDPKAALHWNAGAFFSSGNTDGAFARHFGPWPYEDSAYRIGIRRLAAYGGLSGDVGDGLVLSAGLRAENDRRTLFRSDRLSPAGNYRRGLYGSALLPKLRLDWMADPQTAFYASLGSGFKPGGFSAFTRNAALARFSSERTRAAEFGATRETADHAFSATLRGFWYEISGYQIERSFQTSSGEDDYIVANAPRARSTGGELELAWKPIAGLRFSAALGATRVVLREFRDPYTGTDYSGHRAPYVPRFDASLSAEYRHRCGFFAQAGLTAAGRTDFTEANTDFFAQQSRSLVNARLGYGRRDWSVAVFGENLGDRAYYTSIAPGTYHGTPGAPRTVGAEASLRF